MSTPEERLQAQIEARHAGVGKAGGLPMTDPRARAAEERAARHFGGTRVEIAERLRRLRALPYWERMAINAMIFGEVTMEEAAFIADMPPATWARKLAYPTIRRYMVELQRDLAPARMALAIGTLVRAATDPAATPKERVRAADLLLKYGGGDKTLSLAPTEATAVQVNVNQHSGLPAGPGEIIRPGFVLDLRPEAQDERHRTEDATVIEELPPVIDGTPSRVARAPGTG